MAGMLYRCNTPIERFMYLHVHLAPPAARARAESIRFNLNPPAFSQPCHLDKWLVSRREWQD